MRPWRTGDVGGAIGADLSPSRSKPGGRTSGTRLRPGRIPLRGWNRNSAVSAWTAGDRSSWRRHEDGRAYIISGDHRICSRPVPASGFLLAGGCSGPSRRRHRNGRTWLGPIFGDPLKWSPGVETIGYAHRGSPPLSRVDHRRWGPMVSIRARPCSLVPDSAGPVWPTSPASPAASRRAGAGSARGSNRRPGTSGSPGRPPGLAFQGRRLQVRMRFPLPILVAISVGRSPWSSAVQTLRSWPSQA